MCVYTPLVLTVTLPQNLKVLRQFFYWVLEIGLA